MNTKRTSFKPVVRVLILAALLVAAAAAALLFAGCSKKAALDTVSGADYDGTTISWSSVPNARSYTVLINGQEYREVEGTSVAYDAAQTSFTVAFIANGDGEEYENSETSAEFSFRYLQPVQNIKLVDGILHWDPVENATGYKLMINGVEQSEVLTENSYSGLTPGSSESVYVKAVAEGEGVVKYFSEYSNETIANVTIAPVLKFDNASLRVYWDAVDTASGYKVSVQKDGQTIETRTLGMGETSYSYSYQQAGTYAVRVQTLVAAGSSLNDSKYSDPMEIVRLSNPKQITTEQASDTTVNVMFEDVPKAQNFEVRVNGVVENLTQRNSFEYRFPASSTEQNHTITIVSRGDGNTVLDALEAEQFTLTKLGQPTNLAASGEKLMWNRVNKASGYVVTIDGEEYIAETNEMDLPELSAGSHQIRVRARGNGSNVIDSSLTETYTVQKLSAPDNLRISENILTWNAVQGAENYIVYIDDQVRNSSAASFQIDGADVAADSLIKVMAVGNGAEVLDSNFSASLVVHRLSAPGNFTTDNENLKWNAVPGASGYTLRVNSRVYTGITTTSFSWSNLTAGEKRISIMAVGDGETFFDSGYTAEIVVEKLETPVLTVGATGYEWNAVAGAFEFELAEGSTRWFEDGSARRYEPNYTTAGNKVFMIRAVGDGSSTVSSQWAEIQHSVTAEEGLPHDDAFAVKQEGNAFVIQVKSPIDGATYLYNIDGKDYESQESSYSYTRNTAGTFTVRIAVKGDGFNTVSSDYCASQSYTVLGEPGSISISYIEDDFYLIRWDNVSGAMNYKIEYTVHYNDGSVSDEITFTQTQTSFEFDASKGVQKIEIRVTAIGNGNTTFDSGAKEETLLPLGD